MRIVQVGLGGFGRSWAELAHRAPEIELVAVVDSDSSALAWARTSLDIAPERCVASLTEAVASYECEAVLVITPPPTHAAIAVEALQAGKHVLIEKPLATTLAEAQVVVETAARQNRVAMVSQNYRFRPPARAAQRLVADGALGSLTHVAGGFRRDTRRLWPADNYRYAMRHPLLLDMAIHHVDLLRAVTGQNVRRVVARSWRVPDSPYRHDPALVAVCTLDGGATVVYSGDWTTHDRETSWNAEWDIAGTQGRLLWRGGEATPLTGELTLEEWGRLPVTVDQPVLAASDRAGTLEAFRLAVERGQQPETSAADNIQSLAIVLACVASTERDEAVDLDQMFTVTDSSR